MTTLPTLDQEVFDELHESVCGQTTTVASLYETFFKNAAHLMQTLRVSEPGTTREKTLHTLKGSAGMMGASRIAQLATDLQQTCSTLDADSLQDATQQLDAQLAKLRQDVDARLASLRVAAGSGGY